MWGFFRLEKLYFFVLQLFFALGRGIIIHMRIWRGWSRRKAESANLRISLRSAAYEATNLTLMMRSCLGVKLLFIVAVLRSLRM